MLKEFRPALMVLLVMTVLAGLAYPLAITLAAKILFPRQAGGSLIEHEGRLAGSALIGQSFTQPRYFHGRPSAAGDGYDAANSGGSNLAPTSRKLVTAVRERAQSLSQSSGGKPIPIDLVTASGSGLDPHISPAAAFIQISRIAKARGAAEEDVRRLAEKHIEYRTLGLLGEPRVNVLRLNLALDAMPQARDRTSDGHTGR